VGVCSGEPLRVIIDRLWVSGVADDKGQLHILMLLQVTDWNASICIEATLPGGKLFCHAQATEWAHWQAPSSAG
jgi:hypothetical protein